MITYHELLQLDSERTQGLWEAGVHPANHNMNIIKPIMMGNRVGKLPEWEGSHAYFKSQSDAQYIAAMPDAVGLLKAYHGALIYAIAKLESANQFNDGLGLEFAISKLRQLLEEEQKP